MDAATKFTFPRNLYGRLYNVFFIKPSFQHVFSLTLILAPPYCHRCRTHHITMKQMCKVLEVLYFDE